MSTKSDLINNQKSFIRRLNKNKDRNTINVNIPHPLVVRLGLRDTDYVQINYKDDVNQIVLSRINIKGVTE